MTTGAQGPLGGYRPQLIVRDDGYTFRIRELGLIASGNDVEGAYAALESSYSALLEEARAADLLDELPPPGPMASGAGAGAAVTVARGSLRDFVIRIAIVVVAVLVLLVPLGSMVAGSMRGAVAELKMKGKIGEKLERELERAARPTKALAPERREKILSDLRVLVARAAPYLAEIRPLFADPACPAEPDAGDR